MVKFFLALLFPCVVFAGEDIDGLPLGKTILERRITGQVKAPETGIQYQLMYMFRPDVGEEKETIPWTPLAGYSSNGNFSVPLDGVGVYDFHLNGVKTGTGEKVINEYLGQVEVTNDSELSRVVFYAQEHIRTYNVPVSKYLHVFEHKERNREISTNVGFARFVEQAFVPTIFPESVKNLGPNAVYALHAMNMVAALYHYGNVKNEDALGCALDNERSSSVKDFSGFVGSYIGCCYDYAALLSYVLKMKGIESRYEYIPGHVFLDVKIDGKTYTLDPTVNIAHVGGIRAVMEGDGYILEFPLVGADMGNKYESQAVPRFRRKLISWIALASPDDISNDSALDLMKRIEAIVF